MPGEGDTSTRPAPTPSLDEIYREHWTFIWRSARKLGIPLDRLEDVVQDVFIVAGRQLPHFEGRSSIKTWLYAITFRVVQEHHRRIEREQRDNPRAASELEPMERIDAALTLQRLLSTLDEDKRVVFVFAELEGMSAQEIATHLEVNVNTVSSRLRLARERLSRALERVRARQRTNERRTGVAGA